MAITSTKLASLSNCQFSLSQLALAFPDELVLAMIAVELEHCFQAFNLQLVYDSLYSFGNTHVVSG